MYADTNSRTTSILSLLGHSYIKKKKKKKDPKLLILNFSPLCGIQQNIQISSTKQCPIGQEKAKDNNR